MAANATTTDDTVSSAARPQTGSPFFKKLPPETRTRIYGFALRVDNTPWVMNDDPTCSRLFFAGEYNHGWIVANPNCMGILLACRKMEQEVIPLLYHHVEIQLSPSSCAESQLMRINQKYLQTIEILTVSWDLRRKDEVLTSSPPGSNLSTEVAGPRRAMDVLRLLQLAGARVHTVILKAPWHDSECTLEGSMGPIMLSRTSLSRIRTLEFFPWPYVPDFLEQRIERLQGKRVPGLHANIQGWLSTALRFEIARRAGCGFIQLTNPTPSTDTVQPLSCQEWDKLLTQWDLNVRESLLGGLPAMERVDNPLRSPDTLNGIDEHGHNWRTRDQLREEERKRKPPPPPPPPPIEQPDVEAIRNMCENMLGLSQEDMPGGRWESWYEH